MVSMKNRGPDEGLALSKMPFYFRHRNAAWNTYVRLGEVIRSVNPYFGTEEKQCSGHICRVLCPNKTYDEALVIRDDGTVWKIWLSNFQNWNLIAVQIDM